MRAIVVDANVVIRATDAREPGHREAVERFMDVVGSGVEPIGPDLLLYEVGNYYRRHTGPAPAQGFVDALATCEFRQLTLEEAVRACGLASAARVSYHDAAYVALAESERTWLWTEDRELLRKFPDRAVATADVMARLR